MLSQAVEPMVLIDIPETSGLKAKNKPRLVQEKSSFLWKKKIFALESYQ